MKALKVAALLLLLLFEELGTSSSKNYEVPNMALKGFTYWSTTLSNKYQCESLCWKSVSCRSVNFNTKNGTCELNFKGNQTNDDLTPDERTLYDNSQHSQCRGRYCKENELCISVQGVTDNLCFPAVVKCEYPIPMPHAGVTLRDPENIDYTGKAEHTCDPGFYPLGGSMEVECQSDGQWSATSGYCEPVDCGQPQVIPHGRFTLTTGNTAYMATARVICDTHYKPSTGGNTIWCLETGEWSHSDAACIHKCLSHTGYSFHENPNLCYDVKLYQYNWTKAQEVCQKDGGDLVKLNTTDRMNFMKSVLDLDFSTTVFWIGAKKSGSGWLWIDGTHIDVAFWNSGQPSGDGLCANVNTGMALLNDRPCKGILRAICEIVV